jgi:hypothetical protein
MDHCRTDVTLWADTHNLPNEELLIAGGSEQGYPPGLIGETTVKSLHAVNQR